MGYEQRDMSGSLFKNADKASDNHPDYSGSCLIGGTEYWMSAWLKESESGRRWMSFSFKPKEAKPTGKTHGEMKRGSSAPPPKRTHDDDIPF